MGAREKDLNPDTFIGLQLPLGYSDSGFFKQTKTTFDQAKYNIINLFKTIPGERLGQPTYAAISINIIPGEASLKSLYVFGKYDLANSIRFCLIEVKSLPRYLTSFEIDFLFIP